jgi:hypothetical protein
VIRIIESKDVGRLLARKAARFSEAEAVVRPILEDVRKRGDRALMEYARKFDGLERKSVRVPEKEIASAQVSAEFRQAVEAASANIRAYAERQMPKEWSAQIRPGVRLGQIVRPLDTVAAYIPAGRYPLPSTVMMTVIPAQVAGVPNVCIASPRCVAEVFGTAHLLGVKNGLCVRNEDGAARGPDRGAGEYICGGGEEAAGGRSGDRFRGGADRDPHDRGCGESAAHRVGHAGASGARFGRERDSADHV